YDFRADPLIDGTEPREGSVSCVQLLRRTVPFGFLPHSTCYWVFLDCARSLARDAACSGLAKPFWRAERTRPKSPPTSAGGSSHSPGKTSLRRRPSRSAV